MINIFLLQNAPSARSGYYLNVPPPRDASNPSSRDLPNHDHRGSAFELYKKPPDPRGPPGLAPHQQAPMYLDHGSR